MVISGLCTENRAGNCRDRLLQWDAASHSAPGKILIKGRIQRIFRPTVKGLEKLWQLLQLLLEQGSIFQMIYILAKEKQVAYSL